MGEVKSKYNIYKKLLLYFPIFSILITILLTIGVIYLTFQEYYHKEKKEVKKEFFHNLKIVTKQRVDTSLKVLKYIYKLELNEEQNKLKDILNILTNKTLPSNIILKISKKPLKIDKNYIYVYKKINGKYYYLLESKNYIKNKVKSYIPILFDAFRWGKKGYIFVHDTKGVCYYHIDKSKIGKNRWNLKRNGVFILQKLIKAALSHPEGTYVKYIGYNPLGKPTEKISYIIYYKPLDLTIGSGVYINDLNKRLIKLEVKKEELLYSLLKKLMFTIIFIFIVVSIFAFIITKYILNKFSEYEKNLKRLQKEKYEKECIDSLTGFLNRKCLRQEFEKYKNQNLAIIVIDVNDFKNINEIYGHKIGNEFIKILSQRVKNSIPQAIFAKGKIDEFIVLIKYDSKDEVNRLVKKLYKKLKRSIKIKSKEIFPSIRIGIAFNKLDSSDFDDLVSKASISAYNVKNEEIKIAYYNQDIDKYLKEYLEIKNELEKMMRKNDFSEFQIYYQPQIDKNEKLAGMEALIRWNHPQKGIISPGIFLPIAINEGMIKKIDLYTIETVIKQINEWIKKGFDPGVVACNVTMQQLESKDFISKLKALIRKYEFNTKYLGIEITEESIMQNRKDVLSTLEKIKELGISISLDDFGTGYSNFSKLKTLPIDKLKIDKSFIDGIPDNPHDVALTKIIIQTGKILGMKLVAEGVETKVQKDFVFENGVDYIQGYFYYKPMPADEIERNVFNK